MGTVENLGISIEDTSIKCNCAITVFQGVPMVTTATRCWAQVTVTDASPAPARMAQTAEDTSLPPVTRTTATDRWSATVTKDTQVQLTPPLRCLLSLSCSSSLAREVDDEEQFDHVCMNEQMYHRAN